VLDTLPVVPADHPFYREPAPIAVFAPHSGGSKSTEVMPPTI
jgi:hypothetical protein